MTKERRLAVQMWADISIEILKNNAHFKRRDVDRFKENFCKRHNLEWHRHCYFCTYINDCNKCPISKADGGKDCFDEESLYQTAYSYSPIIDERAGAAVKIAKILEGK